MKLLISSAPFLLVLFAVLLSYWFSVGFMFVSKSVAAGCFQNRFAARAMEIWSICIGISMIVKIYDDT